MMKDNFNPRSPSGLRHSNLTGLRHRYAFQSTQPEWAATIGYKDRQGRQLIFQSTQPEWAATEFIKNCVPTGAISIHAARVGCDSIRINCNYYLFYSYKSAKLTFLLN